MANIKSDIKLINNKELIKNIRNLNKSVLSNKIVNENDIRNAYLQSININQETEQQRINRRSNIRNNNNNSIFNKTSIIYFACIILTILIATPLVNNLLQYLLGIRCLFPNNYLIWELTRPLTNCTFCEGITRPLILSNLTSEEFKPYAYSSQPIIIKKAVLHWPAIKLLNYTFLKELYLRIPGSIENVHEDCQYLGFKSNLMTLRDVFEMSKERVEYQNGQEPWYVGWSNCNPEILMELRKLYPRPHFLPEDSEMPNTDFVFLGYEQGAIMHLDYIPRLMWQSQLRGNKTWVVSPTTECENKCNSFSFYVEAGDAVLVDTRVWYHGTYIKKGEFSLTIQSEYG